MTESNPSRTTRRTFLKQSSAAALGSSLLSVPLGARPRRRGEETIRIALVGCGGRGAGAANQALSTAGPVKLVAMADAFRDRLDGAYNSLVTNHADRVDVPEERKFVGFDAYKKAIDLDDVDMLVTAAPPGFRPMHFEYAIQRGKHVFMEKPVAIDAPGIRKVLAAGKLADEKNLKVGVGLQRHHEARYRETIKRIWDGAIGDITLLRCYWNGTTPWVRPRQAGMTEMEYQMRNWYYFNWLCGDHIVEQHIHNLDVCNWIMRGYPVKAQGQGGRQVRTGLEHGEIYDHHMVEFTYEDDTKMLSQCRHMQNCWNSVSEHVHGVRGIANAAGRILGADGEAWRFQGDNPNPYQVEHDDLFDAIRKDLPYNEAEYGALSTMTSIFGRMATYSGQELKWEDALASELDLMPKVYAWDADPPTLPDENGRYPIPTPGVTRVL